MEATRYEPGCKQVVYDARTLRDEVALIWCVDDDVVFRLIADTADNVWFF